MEEEKVKEVGLYSAYVTATKLNVRSGAGTNYSRIAKLSKGEEVVVQA